MSKEKAEKKEDKENLEREDKPTTNRWLPLVAALLIIGLGLIIGYFLGLRITYAPELENSWDAISGVAAWVGILASIGGSFVAVRYAVRVADKQNQIELFEKRFKIYQLYIDCKSFARHLDCPPERDEIYQRFVRAFYLKDTLGIPDDKLYDIDPVEICKKSYDIDSEMLSSVFLFDEEIASYITDAASKMRDVILINYKTDSIEERQKKVDSFKAIILDSKVEYISVKIEKLLTLK